MAVPGSILLLEELHQEVGVTSGTEISTEYKHGVFYLNVTEKFKKPTLEVILEGFDSVSKEWFTIVKFKKIKRVGKKRLLVDPLIDNPIRATGIQSGRNKSTISYTVSLITKI